MPKQFTVKQVKEILGDVFDYYGIENTVRYKEDFERYLNDQGLNGNNGDNEDKMEKYTEENIESFIH